MKTIAISRPHPWTLMGNAEPPPALWFGETEIELWPYRRRTIALLRRYARGSVEVGRLPSLLGREFFRSRVTSYTMRNFEDVVIFVADMEHAIEKLSASEKRLLAMNVLEEYTVRKSRECWAAPKDRPSAFSRTRSISSPASCYRLDCWKKCLMSREG